MANLLTAKSLADKFFSANFPSTGLGGGLHSTIVQCKNQSEGKNGEMGYRTAVSG